MDKIEEIKNNVAKNTTAVTESIKEQEEEISYCHCFGGNACGFEPGPKGRLICSQCGKYLV